MHLALMIFSAVTEGRRTPVFCFGGRAVVPLRQLYDLLEQAANVCNLWQAHDHETVVAYGAAGRGRSAPKLGFLFEFLHQGGFLRIPVNHLLAVQLDQLRSGALDETHRTLRLLQLGQGLRGMGRLGHLPG